MHIGNSRRLLLGVCSGLAEDIGCNPWIVRVLFLVLAHAVGAGILIYLILYLMMDKS